MQPLRRSLVLIALAGCSSRKAPPSPPPDAGPAPAPAAVETLVLAGPNQIRAVAFAPAGELVVLTRSSIFRDAMVRTLPERWTQSATAKNADVTVIAGEMGTFYVVRPNGITKLDHARAAGPLSIADNGRAFLMGDAAFDLAGHQIGQLDQRSGLLSPDGMWAATDGHIVSLNDAAPIAVNGSPRAWFGTTALYEGGKKGVVLVDVTTGAKTDLLDCRQGRSLVDSIARRLIVSCPNQITVVDVDRRTSDFLLLPRMQPIGEMANLAAVADSTDLFGRWADPNGGEHWMIRLDPQNRIAQTVTDGSTPALRGFDGQPSSWERAYFPAPDHAHWARVWGAGVEIAEPNGHLVATWGPAAINSDFDVRVNGRGLDIRAAKPFRIGPDAPPAPDAGTADAHVDVHAGDVTNPTSTVRVIGSNGQERGFHTFNGFCNDAVVNPDAKSAAVLCWSPGTSDEVVELDLGTGKETRRTKLASDHESKLVAVRGNDVLVRNGNDYIRVLDAGTGHVRAELFMWNTAAVARFDDGALELFGDTTFAESAIRCVSAGVSKPFATCRADREAHGRFSLR